MPLFAVICRDRKDALSIRQENRPGHLAYIEETGIVTMAGPLIEAGEMAGSLIVLDCDSIDAARTWAKDDPYGRAGLFERVEVIEWRKVIG